ncbi:hypothetical protein OC834_006309, partial [Tilletia horrida]
LLRPKRCLPPPPQLQPPQCLPPPQHGQVRSLLRRQQPLRPSWLQRRCWAAAQSSSCRGLHRWQSSGAR